MCRNIKCLRHPDGMPTDGELEAAARQFVRKISGYRQPSMANQAAFEDAVMEIASVSRTLFDSLATRSTATPARSGAGS